MIIIIPGDTIFINQAARTRPLIYNLNVISFNRNDYANTDSFDMAGARNVKYYPEPGSNGADMGNDLVMMRLADVILMKVEAELRLNGSVSSIALLIVFVKELMAMQTTILQILH
jgi:hypothetical protein